MRDDIIGIEVQGVVPTNQGSALFLGNKLKTILMYIDNYMGKILLSVMKGEQRERPLTHDLIAHIFKGFEIRLERVVIPYAHEGTFHARMILKLENDLGIKLLEVDARPSDSIILALQQARPIYMTKSVLDKLEDVSDILKKVFKPHPGL